MRASDIARRGADYLARHDVASPRVDADALLAAVLDTDPAAIATWGAEPSAEQARAYGRALCRRASGTPLQHLTGEQPFRYLTIPVRAGVFIPRPESEVVVDVALARIEGVTSPGVADVCTGTGAIALSIAHERPDARVVASDLAPEAVALARENARALALAIDVREGDLLDPIQGPLDLVTCNPPYVSPTASDTLPREVLADPERAVFGGLEIVARLFAQAFERLRPGGWVVVEIEETTGDEVRGLAAAAGYVDASETPDLAGRPRVVAARRPGPA